MQPAIPIWLQVLLGLFSIVAPEFLWVVPAIKLAYQIFLLIPWFHKPAALVELRKAVRAAKMGKDPTELHSFSLRWKKHCEGIGVPIDVVGLE